MGREIRHNSIMISGVKSGSGKTMISCALLSMLKQRGVNVGAYKCGPDYIDPMFHQKCIGVPSENLDSFFLEEEQLKELYMRSIEEHATELSIVEGAMGLYDGIGGTSENASAYDVASKLGIPIVLVVDAHGMGRSILPLVSGYLSFDRHKLIKGVILNRVSGALYVRLRYMLETELGIAVCGYVEKQSEAFDSRHLGLVMPDEIDDIRGRLISLSKAVGRNLDIEKILDISKTAEAIKLSKDTSKETSKNQSKGTYKEIKCNRTNKKPDNNSDEKKIIEVTDITDSNINKPVIAVAKDEAFCFYYEENLRILREMGASLTFFSPIHDDKLPAEADAIIIGGGYPELWAKELSANESMKQSIYDAIKNGMPTIAECGGFMYLHDKLRTVDDIEYDMVGVVNGTVHYTGKLVRFGYVSIYEEAQDREKSFLVSGKSIKGHEFHYFDSTDNGADCIMKKPASKLSWSGIHVDDTSWLGFPHLYLLSCPDFAGRFIDKAIKYKYDNMEKSNGELI